MALINNPERNEVSSQQSVPSTYEEDTVDISPSSIEEIGECDLKVQSRSSDFTLEIGSLNSQSSTDGEIVNNKLGSDIKQQLLELEDEIVRLRTENEELKSTLPKTKQGSLIDILFNISHFDSYKAKFVKFLSSFPELCINIDENHYAIHVYEDNDISSNEWVVIDEAEVQNSPSVTTIPRKKRKKDETDSLITIPDQLFIVDTTPSLSTRGQKLSYDTKFTVSNQSDNEEKQNELKSISLCFNCDGDHNLRDCPEPRNHTRINLAKQRFKMQIKTVRYHLEEDQRFTHLKPGKVSEKLRRALGLRNNELPLHIYRMRQLGYPPGWLHEVHDANRSDLVVFDFEGRCDFKRKNGEKPDAEKIIDYPGFNVPMEKGIKDECRLYGCPPYSKNASKERMLEHLKTLEKKAQDNLETCDMDVDSQATVDDLELNIPQEHIGCESPTLVELEHRKQELLAELTKENSSGSNLEPKNKMNTPKGAAYCTLDITGVVEECEESLIENKEELCTENLSPVECIVKNSSFGTPILKSSSPYCSLPSPDNFSQNVSQVINFENLPNSTGKYDQMVGVLEKVRKTLKTINNSKS